jgi:hypothetical protein
MIGSFCAASNITGQLNDDLVSVSPGNTKGGSITVPLTSCLTALESAVSQLTIFVFICKRQWVQTNRSNICIFPTDICFIAS